MLEPLAVAAPTEIGSLPAIGGRDAMTPEDSQERGRSLVTDLGPGGAELVEVRREQSLKSRRVGPALQAQRLKPGCRCLGNLLVSWRRRGDIVHARDVRIQREAWTTAFLSVPLARKVPESPGRGVGSGQHRSWQE